MATGISGRNIAAGSSQQSLPGSPEEMRIPLSRLDTHRDQLDMGWKNETDKKKAEETLEKMSGAFSALIESVGEQPEREGLKRTPLRAAKALCFFTKGYEDNLASKFKGQQSWGTPSFCITKEHCSCFPDQAARSKKPRSQSPGVMVGVDFVGVTSFRPITCLLL